MYGSCREEPLWCGDCALGGGTAGARKGGGGHGVWSKQLGALASCG